jgi:tripartite-type tricarboxylate transporter receptor subunit TctC
VNFTKQRHAEPLAVPTDMGRANGDRIGRRQVVKALAAVAATAALGARADTFPSRPIRLISSLAAGGMSDTFIRAACEGASKHLGQPIVVENRPGASGVLGAVAMAQAGKGDGYLLMQSLMTMVRLPHLQRLSYHPLKDLEYICGLAAASYGIVVRADSPYKSLADLIAAAKAKPGQVSYGSIGSGSAPFMVMEELGLLAGVKWLHVPYKGGTETNTALLGGFVDAVSDSTSWAPLVDAGKLRLLATFGENRLRQWPNVPTAKELGIALVHQSPIGIGGPRGIEPKVIEILDSAFRKATQDPRFLNVLDQFALVPMYMDHAAYTGFMRNAYDREGRLIERLGLKAGSK